MTAKVVSLPATQFYPGDTVRCVKPSVSNGLLEKGKLYKVKKVSDFAIPRIKLLSLENTTERFSSTRFVKVASRKDDFAIKERK